MIETALNGLRLPPCSASLRVRARAAATPGCVAMPFPHIAAAHAGYRPTFATPSG